ncbi:MAG: ATP-binding protein [Candidatus Parcubacteria bacterium]|nr:ATP-binding protein [Candidatus Parcubacteria bacterium]
MFSFTPFEISCLITSLVSFIFGFFTFLNNKKERLNQFWFLISISTGLWSLGLFGVVYSDNYSDAWLWQNILDTSAILIPVFFLTFVFYLLKIQKEYKKRLFVFWFLSIILFILSFTDLFKKGMNFKMGFNYWIDPGPLYFLFPLTFFICVLQSLVLLFKINKKTNDTILKRQIKYVALAQIVGFGGGATNFFPQLFNVYPFGNYLIAIYIFFISYTVLKHHLFNVRVIATELFSLAISVILLIRALLSKNLTDGIVNGFIFGAVSVFGIFLVRSVWQEVRTREEMQKLAGDLAVANERLKELDKAKSDFVSIASHQLRTPITAVKGYSSMLLEGTYGQIPEKAKGALEKIFESSNRLVHMITNYLNVSRIERGKLDFNFQKTDFRGMVSSVMDDFKAVNVKEKKGLDLSLDIDENENYTLNIDAEKIREVIYNIIDNAMKYTPKGFIKVFLSKTPDKKRVVFKVQDSGIGIKRESLEKLFQKFSQAGDKNSGGAIIGVGLGLYVAKEIIQAHHGKIRAESEGEGKGSTFYIELPANHDEQK